MNWPRKRGCILWSTAVALALLLAAAAGFLLFTGPRNLAQYPPAGESPYLLPWPAGTTYWCVQSNRGIVSHRGRGEFACDFYMPVGSDVCASRAGTVVRVVDHHDGHGYHWPNNRVVIRHEDGTHAHYVHGKQNGSYVREGQTVVRGQPICASGHVGNSMMPHLHFQVTAPDSGRTIPVTFADVSRHRGVPRMFRRYTSGNNVP